jgi:hypothetical protein
MRRLLESWAFDPENDARIVPGDDGREVLQVRTILGLEQLEMKGRPDGERPHGMESALEYQLHLLSKARHAGREAEFKLEPAACAELFAEGTLYYLRYLRLFQLRRWDETVRDTERNLRLFDFVHQYAAHEEDQENLEKWRPYIVRMNAAASALRKLEQGRHEQALEIVNAAVSRIEDLDEMDDETFEFEQARSLKALRELASQIEKVRPVSAVERLEHQLQRAVARQEFERAAELRDRIRKLKKPPPAR